MKALILINIIKVIGSWSQNTDHFWSAQHQMKRYINTSVKQELTHVINTLSLCSWTGRGREVAWEGSEIVVPRWSPIGRCWLLSSQSVRVKRVHWGCSGFTWGHWQGEGCPIIYLNLGLNRRQLILLAADTKKTNSLTAKEWRDHDWTDTEKFISLKTKTACRSLANILSRCGKDMHRCPPTSYDDP